MLAVMPAFPGEVPGYHSDFERDRQGDMDRERSGAEKYREFFSYDTHEVNGGG